VSFVAAITTVLAVAMIALCGRHWKKEYAGLGKTFRTFVVCLGIVAAYYAILVIWFWNMIPREATKG
jgi:Na+-driven multidrug efflux pump